MVTLLDRHVVGSIVWYEWEGDNDCLYSRHSYLLTKQSSSLDALGLPKVLFLIEMYISDQANGFGEEELI